MQFEQRIVHSLLCEWGSYEEAQISASAYSTITPLWRYQHEGSPGKPVFASTILAQGTPQHILSIKHGITQLPHTQQQVITAKYVFHLKPEGGLWTDREKAALLALTYSAYNTTIHRARHKLLTWL
jgi:DNA-directed RNA polymerase specialized sigma24 family protein